MNRAALVLAAVLAGGCVHASHAQGPFSLVNVIALPGVSGRIDHLAIDLAGNRLFVAALGNNSVEVLDLGTGAVLNSITGLSEPQGVAFLPDRQRLYVANGGTGTCNVYDGRTLALRTAIDRGGDPDNIHYDAASGSLFVSAGSGLGIIDPANVARAGYIRLAGHPEGFALSHGARRIYANVPTSRKVVVVDAQARQVVAEWPAGAVTGNFFSNFPLALDDADNRVFIGSRVPPRLLVLDAGTGKAVADIRIDDDPDDVFYDDKRGKTYVSCGSGYLDVITRTPADRYSMADRMTTGPGARTSLWVPELDELFVAVPRGSERGAEVRIYRPTP